VPRHHEDVSDRGHPLDRTTQAWVRATGRRVSLAEHPWLDGPVGDPNVIGDEWVSREAARLDGSVRGGGGLLASVASLDSNRFNSKQLAREVASFYERTTEWRLEVWSQWCPAAWPVAWALTGVFARRLQQLGLPLRPLDVARGMESRVLAVVNDDGAQLPRTSGPSVRVMFPLPNGSIAVFLRPTVDRGALQLTSPIAEFGDDGAYLIVVHRDGKTAWVRRVPLAEQFRVFVDEEGVLRTDHALDLWNIPVIRFHYRLDESASAIE
jgi:hypothetical protein